MKERSSRRSALAAGILVAAFVSTAGQPVAAAESLPWDDPNVTGHIGFCDRNKEPVTSGSLYDQPFVWTAVSSEQAPTGYEQGMAVLLAFQPREDVEPGLWSGTQLTGSSDFTNSDHPMAQATYADGPLISFVQAYPPNWDGLVQLRMYFGAEETPGYRFTYPATTIRISGHRWSIVDGGTAPCDAGKAVSIETKTLPRSEWASPPPPIEVDGEVPGTGAGGGSSTEGGATTGNGSAHGAEDVATRASSESGSGSGPVAAGLIGVAIIGAVVGAVLIWRRTRQPSG